MCSGDEWAPPKDRRDGRDLKVWRAEDEYDRRSSREVSPPPPPQYCPSGQQVYVVRSGGDDGDDGKDDDVKTLTMSVKTTELRVFGVPVAKMIRMSEWTHESDDPMGTSRNGSVSMNE